jgi:hypothetical protein
MADVVYYGSDSLNMTALLAVRSRKAPNSTRIHMATWLAPRSDPAPDHQAVSTLYHQHLAPVGAYMHAQFGLNTASTYIALTRRRIIHDSADHI